MVVVLMLFCCELALRGNGSFGENRKDYQPWMKLAADNRYLGIINSKARF